MGNLTYLLPTRATDACTSVDFGNMLRGRFAQLTVAVDPQFDQLRVSTKAGDDLVCMVYPQPCPLVEAASLQQDIAEARRGIAAGEEDADVLRRLLKLQALNLSPTPAVALTYATAAAQHEVREQVLAHLKTIFEAYVVDEGTYPDFDR